MEFTEFIEQLGSTSPAPGGGAAAGISISLGAACAEKAIRFSKGENLADSLETFVKARITGQKLCEEDQFYFLEWQKTRKLPKNTEEEKENRIKQFNKAAIACTAIPYRIGKLAIILLDEIEKVLFKCSPFLISDLACSIIFVKSAFESSCFNIRINLPYIKEYTFEKELNSFLTIEYENFVSLEKKLLSLCEKIILE